MSLRSRHGWLQVPSWVSLANEEALHRVSAREEQRQASSLMWVSFIAVKISAVYTISSWLRGQANPSSQEDQRSVFLQFNFFKYRKYFPNDKIYKVLFLFKNYLWQDKIYKPLLDVFCVNDPKVHSEGDGWSLTTVRCFAPAEVKASNPFWREQWRGCLRTAQQNM